MRGQGDYPWGAADDPNAPWNEKHREPRYEECEECNGVGYTYYAYNFVLDDEYEVSEDEWNALPADEELALARHQHVIRGSRDECIHCNGEGVVEVEEW